MAANTKRAPAPAKSMYQLGLPAHLTAREFSERFRNWHTPRTNHWEYLRVAGGHVTLQWLDMAGVSMQELAAGTERWVGPGVRWRVTEIDADTQVELETHVDNSEPVHIPRRNRAALLDDAESLALAETDALARSLASLEPGGRFILRSGVDPAQALRACVEGFKDKVYAHPLEASRERWTTLVLRSQYTIGLLEYLTLDHAVSEAALKGALDGDRERLAWLRNGLLRHIAIEETILFPAYLDVGGNGTWVYGLRNDHNLLRNYLDDMGNETARKRFLLLLDGHDEREEEIVYIDLIARLGTRIAELTERSVSLALVPEAPAPETAASPEVSR